MAPVGTTAILPYRCLNPGKVSDARRVGDAYRKMPFLSGNFSEEALNKA